MPKSFEKLIRNCFSKVGILLQQFITRKENLLSVDKAIEERVLEVYSERLQPNTIKAHLNAHEKNVN